MKKIMIKLIFILTILCMIPFNSIAFAKEDEIKKAVEKINEEFPLPAETPQTFIDRTIASLELGYFKEKNEEKFDRLKKAIQSEKETVETINQAKGLLRNLLYLSGGKHSSFYSKNENDEFEVGSLTKEIINLQSQVSDSEGEDRLPSYSYENQIVYLNVPGYSKFPKYSILYNNREYSDILLKAYDEFGPKHPKGIIIDLRENTGGQYFTMIPGLFPLLDEGEFFSVINKKGEITDRFSKIGNNFISNDLILNIEHTPVDKVPIAVLTSRFTASAGEAITMCFMDMPNVKIFGHPTAGYNSYLTGIPINYDCFVSLVTHMMRTKEGQVFYEEPIEPDVLTDHPMEDAVEWLESQM
ncbi:S41 family peptidase [Facklamia miroungae]|uniref:Peptidase family S41 n=1 Tax=Facklamia miroungae TaxID=120956 RepID=A0A1G7PWG9_9LACT|nr:S41 family peptidase [Facklamia miroungae]NKZ28836.1 hypothetical protein [Facklamia miroungae]SDF89959.1 Peptidase family S41 [Facklamia miroungae]